MKKKNFITFDIVNRIARRYLVANELEAIKKYLKDYFPDKDEIPTWDVFAIEESKCSRFNFEFGDFKIIKKPTIKINKKNIEK